MIDAIWEQYKRTFLGVQVLAAGSALWAFHMTHWWGPPAAIFGVMQVSAFFGAAWAARIRRRIQRFT